MRRLVRALARRKSVLSPLAWRELQPLVASPGAWRATGPEPAIDLACSRARFPSGWVELSIDIAVNDGDSALGWILADDARVRVPRTADGKVRQIVRLPDDVRALRYKPIKGEGTFTLGSIVVREIGWPEVFFRQMVRYCRGEDLSPVKALRAAAVHARVHGPGALWTWMRQYVGSEHADKFYAPWVAQRDSWTADGLRTLKGAAEELTHRPKFSIVMPVHDTAERWLRKAIDSVVAQAYDNWELCICDDNSGAPHVAAVLDTYRRADRRIKVLKRSRSGHIAVATNDAMSLMTGDFMCLLDHDDAIAPDALFEFAKALNADPGIELLYSDEDLISIDDVRYEPILKPDWSPENLESYMYLGHLTCYRADLAREIGGFRPEYSGAQDYDFALRYTEQAKNIHHVGKILYHWRAVPGSIAVSIEQKDYVVAAAMRALEDRLRRAGDTGTVVPRQVRGWFETRRDVVGTPLVSIVVSGVDLEAIDKDRGADLLAACLESIRSKSTYRNYEIIAVGERGNLADRLNEAAGQAKGAYLVFLSGDTKVVSPDWLESMLGHIQRPGTGVVGAKLLFGDDTLRHVGMALCSGLPRYIRRGYPASDWGYWGSSSVARNYLAVSGACMMVRRDDFCAVGGFDPTMAPAYHDVDLCLKMVKRGRRNIFTPSASLYQLAGDCRADHVDAATLFRARWQHVTTPDPFYGAHLTLKPPTFEFDPGV